MPTSTDIKQPQRSPVGAGFRQSSSRPSIPRFAIILAVVIIAVVALIIVLKGFGSRDKLLPSQETSGYKAVFLSNGQVYFGHLTGLESQYPILSDIYYLKLKEPLQPQTTEVNVQKSPELTLIKLGNELHGPIDEMQLNRDHILFVETLRQDSKVVNAINDFRKQMEN